MTAPTQPSADSAHADRLLVQIASYNTNLQGINGLPQNLVDWLAPTLHVSSFLSKARRAPDIVAVGFQELLPLHLGLSGFSSSVVDSRDALIRSQIEEHAPNKEKYFLIAKVVNVGVALLVYGRDDGVVRDACDIQTQWTGSGRGYMGNKGAVGVRFRIPGTDGDVGEAFTFVCAHLTAHQGKVKERLADYDHIVKTLVFPSQSGKPSTIYSTSHLFFFGDLNFRLDIPSSSPLFSIRTTPGFAHALEDDMVRADLKDYDELRVQMQNGNLIGLREGEFWKFKCSYKYVLGEVDKYSIKRVPSWTDRILYATHTDSPEEPSESHITNLLYTSVPSYVTSDHKPVVCLLLLPSPQRFTSPPRIPPVLRLPEHYTPAPDSLASFKRSVGRTLDRVIGTIWTLFVFFGSGSSVIGIIILCGWAWWRSRSGSVGPINV